MNINKTFTIILIALILPASVWGMGALKKKALNDVQAEQVQKIAIYEAQLVAEKILLQKGLPSNNPVAPDIELDNSPGPLGAVLNTVKQVIGKILFVCVLA